MLTAAGCLLPPTRYESAIQALAGQMSPVDAATLALDAVQEYWGNCRQRTVQASADQSVFGYLLLPPLLLQQPAAAAAPAAPADAAAAGWLLIAGFLLLLLLHGVFFPRRWFCLYASAV